MIQIRRQHSAAIHLGTLATLLVVTLVACRTHPQNSIPDSTIESHPARVIYTTRFPSNEESVSEGGRWIGGKTVGLDWGDVSTAGGIAQGHAGPKKYADSVALLTGDWGPDQSAEAVVQSNSVSYSPEVSLRLRSELAAHRATGYEVSFSLKDGDGAYLILVRWNGPLADFTYLKNLQGRQYGAKTGDVVKATIVGNVITAYKNGVRMAQATDSTFTTGSPGFGFNEGTNGDYGITRFTAGGSGTDRPSK